MKVTIDFDLIKNKFPTGKKNIVCFGAGYAGKILLDNLPPDFQIQYFTDNNNKIVGKKIGNVNIISPQQIISLDNVFIVIVSRHVEPIKKQLSEYGFIEGIDFVDIYLELQSYFCTAKAIELSKTYIKYIKNINKYSFVQQTENNKKIGIAVLGEMSIQKMFFQLTLYLILKKKKYNVYLILDFVGDFSDFNWFEGANQFIQELFLNTLDEMEDTIGQIEYLYVKEEKCYLSQLDLHSVKVNTHDTIKRYCAYVLNKKHDEKYLQAKLNDEIKKHLMSLKSFFKKERFDIVATISGITDRRWNYTYLGHQQGMRIPSYDMDCWSTDYPACWNYDLKNKLVLNKNEQDIYAKRGEELFLKRKYDNFGDPEIKQLVKYNEGILKYDYDILIPLNVMFDSAVLGLDRIFSTPEEWLYETVEYLYKNTKAKVLIRESPVDFTFTTVNYPCYRKLLENFIDNKRIFYSERLEKVNIYNLIEKSKIILPFSSTSGIESAIMNKPVVVHTNCFYRDEEFVVNAQSKNDYFNKIIYFLHNKHYVTQGREKALIYFYIIHSKLNKNISNFNEAKVDWLYEDFENIFKNGTLDNMVNVIAENKIYSNIRLS